MTIEIVLKFIKRFWRELIIAGLVATILFMNVQKGVLESELALCEQKKVNTEERLKVSNGSIDELQLKLKEQNNKLQEISDKSKQKIEDSKKMIEEAEQNNKNLQEKIDALEKQGYDSSVDECTNIKNLLKNVGE